MSCFGLVAAVFTLEREREREGHDLKTVHCMVVADMFWDLFWKHARLLEVAIKPLFFSLWCICPILKNHCLFMFSHMVLACFSTPLRIENLRKKYHRYVNLFKDVFQFLCWCLNLCESRFVLDVFLGICQLPKGDCHSPGRSQWGLTTEGGGAFVTGIWKSLRNRLGSHHEGRRVKFSKKGVKLLGGG